MVLAAVMMMIMAVVEKNEKQTNDTIHNALLMQAL